MGVVGSISQKSFFGRETGVEFYEEVAIEAMVFLLWRCTHSEGTSANSVKAKFVESAF
jgi:hypothetical protein